MPREIVEPTKTEGVGGGLGGVQEEHPAFGMITAHRVSSSPGAVLFDSEIRHQHYVTIKISTADRRRDLNRDWIHPGKEIIEVGVSEAQWAQFVSSMNTSGTPCTLQGHFTGPEIPEGIIPEMPYEPRLHESIAEVREASEKALAQINDKMAGVEAAFEAGGKKAMREAIRSLRSSIDNAPRNMVFAADSLTEHAENVVQKSRADIEAMVLAKAQQLGLDAGDVAGIRALTMGDEPTTDVEVVEE
jgi:hypothetical protein